MKGGYKMEKPYLKIFSSKTEFIVFLTILITGSVIGLITYV
ncbi:hypothetical protein LCGC14_1472740 [marine sediment metagenome]|uniref:Uncharacterized protein n=1 Tax=marine sediment metagenome TaxID=412755 RepID=A0A0F9JXW9_9ZZZZ